MNYSGENDINFPNNINHIFKYKNGTAYYILSKLECKPFCNPNLIYNHASNGGNYTNTFLNCNVFEDKFEYVQWNNIKLNKRIEIVKYNKFDKQVNENYDWYTTDNCRISIQIINNKIIEHYKKYHISISDKGINNKIINERYKKYDGFVKGINNNIIKDGTKINNLTFDQVHGGDGGDGGKIGYCYAPFKGSDGELVVTHARPAPTPDYGIIEPVVIRNKKRKKRMVLLETKLPIVLK